MTKQTTHTVGPLPLHYDGHGMNDTGGQRVLTFAKWTDSEGGGYIHTAEARQRYAHLIAAAPELLAALEEAWELIYCCNRVNELNKEHFPHRSPEWVYDHPDTPRKLAMNNLLDALNKCTKSDKARTAISKARGE